MDQFYVSANDLTNGLVRLRGLVSKYSREFDRPEADTPAEASKIPRERFAKAKKQFDRFAKTFIRDSGGERTSERSTLVHDAATVITKVSGSARNAKRPETQIRIALLRNDSYKTRFLKVLETQGLREGEDAVNELMEAHTILESANDSRNTLLRKAEADLKEAATLVWDRQPQTPERHAASVSAPISGVLDFYFGVVGMKDLNKIFGAAFKQLVVTLKGLEYRTDIGTSTDVGVIRKKRMQRQNLATASKGGNLNHSARKNQIMKTLR